MTVGLLLALTAGLAMRTVELLATVVVVVVAMALGREDSLPMRSFPADPLPMTHCSL
jgi:hypothetical protein